ncbi:MAG TPA: hypothetical protein VMZ31_19810 [Phycisphaerae bacterium]|nr:hypothetical protein [Phycisphaerae bacterium]
MQQSHPSPTPSVATVVKTLRDGYWDRTELIRLEDGSLRVRKISKGTAAPGPWGVSTLRREIEYLKALQGKAADLFPALLAAWDDTAQLGYEMACVENSIDVAVLAQSAAMTQQQADMFQDSLGQAVFKHLHQPIAPHESLASHVQQTITEALTRLRLHNEFAPLIDADVVHINDTRLPGLQSAMQRLLRRPTTLETLDAAPCVRLHGDLFLENVLVPRQDDATATPTRFKLIDPVSVAGVYHGHPLFDLVKYESYATGELLAMRAEKVYVDGFADPSAGGYAYRVCTDNPVVKPFHAIDWHSRFRAAYVRRYGQVDHRAYCLLEAYFALVMALCTSGLHQQARVLKATLALNEAVPTDCPQE